MERLDSLDILFVCLGNICRSPIAACIMRSIYKEMGIAGRIESAGTMDWNVGKSLDFGKLKSSKSADHRMIRLAGQRGLDLKMHRARQLSRHDFEEFDLIIVMDREIESTVFKRAPDAMRHKVNTFGKPCLLAFVLESFPGHHSCSSA